MSAAGATAADVSRSKLFVGQRRQAAARLSTHFRRERCPSSRLAWRRGREDRTQVRLFRVRVHRGSLVREVPRVQCLWNARRGGSRRKLVGGERKTASPSRRRPGRG